jgi:hypothetical protein
MILNESTCLPYNSVRNYGNQFKFIIVNHDFGISYVPKNII